jgi:hypothetical protein
VVKHIVMIESAGWWRCCMAGLKQFSTCGTRALLVDLTSGGGQLAKLCHS